MLLILFDLSDGRTVELSEVKYVSSMTPHDCYSWVTACCEMHAVLLSTHFISEGKKLNECRLFVLLCWVPPAATVAGVSGHTGVVLLPASLPPP